MSLHFAAPYALTLVLFLPVVFFAWRRGRGRGGETLRSLWRGPVRDSGHLLPLLLIAAGTLALVAASGPAWGVEKARSRREAADVIFVIDVSRSMAVKDVETSRLEAAKTALTDTLARMDGQRVGVIVFGGSARLRFPLTSDLGAAAAVIEGIQPGMRLVDGGSSLSTGLRLAVESFDSERHSGKLVLVVSDGDDLGTSPLVAAELIRRSDVELLVAGAGTPAGGRIPVFDPRMKTFVDKLSEAGLPIVSALDEPLLQRVAEAGGGVYLGSDLAALPSAVTGRADLLERTATDVRTVEFPIPRFHLFAGAALALVVVASILQITALRAARRPAIAVAAVLTGLFLASCATIAHRENERARELYEEGDLSGAIEHLFTAAAAEPADGTVARNLATALISAGRYEDGARLARRAAGVGTGEEQSRAFRLLGHAEFSRVDMEAALVAFRRGLLLDPSDELLRHDYEVVYELLRQAEEQDGSVNGDGTAPPIPDPGSTPVAGEQPTPAPGRPDGGAGDGSDGNDGSGEAGDGGGRESIESIEEQIAGIDRAVEEIIGDGQAPTAEEAARVLDLLSERSRLNMLRDAFSIGSDPGDY